MAISLDGSEQRPQAFIFDSFLIHSLIICFRAGHTRFLATHLTPSFNDRSSYLSGETQSDAVGDVLGKPEVLCWRDNQSAKVNGIRTKTLLDQCDVAVIRFGDKYRQWNDAFDAGYCAAMGTPHITPHDEDIKTEVR